MMTVVPFLKQSCYDRDNESKEEGKPPRHVMGEDLGNQLRYAKPTEVVQVLIGADGCQVIDNFSHNRLLTHFTNRTY